MNLALSEEKTQFRDLLRRFLDDRYDRSSMGRGPMAPAEWLELAELGFLALLLPERAGGLGGTGVDLMIVSEELGRSLVITPLAESVALAAGLIAACGSDAQIERWVKPVAAGADGLAFARFGSPSESRLDGSVGIVINGMAAAAFVVVTGPGTAAIVPADAEGVTRRAVRMVDGSIAAEVQFAHVCFEPLSCDQAQLARVRASADIAVAGELVGTMATLLDHTVGYVKQRHQFGKPIASFQVIQHRCARHFILLEMARSLLLKAATGEPAAAIDARRYAVEAGLRLAEDAVQLHGGMGITDELAVGRALRRVLFLSRAWGDGAICGGPTLASR